MTAASEQHLPGRTPDRGGFVAVRSPELVAAHARFLAGPEMTAFFENNYHLFLPENSLWSPYEYLPNSSSPDFIDEVMELRRQARTMSPELLVTIAGDYLTELAGELYATALNRLPGYRDETGISQTPQARSIRTWGGEEKPHPEFLGKWMYLTGLYDMKRVFRDGQILLRNGFHPGTSNDPIEGFVYTSIQEPATDISHSGTGSSAKEQTLAVLDLAPTTPVIFERGAKRIAGDESRHGKNYANVLRAFTTLFGSEGVNGLVCALANMARKRIVMPGSGMGKELFAGYSAIAESIGIFTQQHYAQIWVNLLTFLDIEHLAPTSEEAKYDLEWLIKYKEVSAKAAQRQRKPQAIDPNNPAYVWILHEPSRVVEERVVYQEDFVPKETVFQEPVL